MSGNEPNASQAEPVCRLVDTDIETKQSMLVYSLDELKQLLQTYVGREPRILELYLSDGVSLFIGMGGDLAAVTAFPIPNPPRGVLPHWTAQAHRSHSNQTREFTYCNVPHEFQPAALMPPEEVIQLILHFVQYGDLPDSHAWGPPGPGQYRWGSGGTRDEWHAQRQIYEDQQGDIPF